MDNERETYTYNGSLGRRVWVFVPDNGHDNIIVFAGRYACLKMFEQAALENRAEHAPSEIKTSEKHIELDWFGAAYEREIQ